MRYWKRLFHSYNVTSYALSLMFMFMNTLDIIQKSNKRYFNEYHSIHLLDCSLRLLINSVNRWWKNAKWLPYLQEIIISISSSPFYFLMCFPLRTGCYIKGQIELNIWLLTIDQAGASYFWLTLSSDWPIPNTHSIFITIV